MALTYPVSGESTERPLLVAWILVALGFLVPLLPLIPLLGYLVDVLAASQRSAPAPPFPRDAHRLLSRGSKGFAVLAVYLVVPITVLLISIYGALTVSEGPVTGSMTVLTVYAGSTAVFCLAFLGAYLCPIGLSLLGSEGSLRAAFDASSLRETGGHAAYFVGWVAGVVLFGLAGVLAAATFTIPRLGPVIASLVLAYGSILACHVWGRGVSRTK